MWIGDLQFRNCRSLSDISIELSPGINVFHGDNASGKTSLLEALYILSSGRSFRTSHIADVIQHKKPSIIVSASIQKDKKSTKEQVGIEKSNKQTKIRINKKDIYSQAELSQYLPITVIHPLSSSLITGSVSTRRTYLDWICFYLFPEFNKVWKDYKHVLAQRNLCLKTSKHVYALDKWTEELVKYQPTLTEIRLSAIEKLRPILKKTCDILFDDIEISLKLKSGFPASLALNEQSLFNYYKSAEAYDVLSKRTNVGVHRADISILLNNKQADKYASRGSLKLLSVCMLISQNILLGDQIGTKGILLFDDIASELDKANLNKILELLYSLKQQVIITNIEPIAINKAKMFHVKHDCIEEEII